MGKKTHVGNLWKKGGLKAGGDEYPVMESRQCGPTICMQAQGFLAPAAQVTSSSFTEAAFVITAQWK